jgi:hypothetical protein
VDQLHLAQLARDTRVMPQVKADRTRVWNRWLAYLASHQRSSDPFLGRLDRFPHLKPVVIGGFAQALRSGELQQYRKKGVVGDTVRGNIDKLVQTFRDHRHKNPTLDPDGSFSAVLSWQLSGYRNVDPATTRQKAISVQVLKSMKARAITNADIAAAALAMGAFFFACRSCEYSRVPGPRRTKTMRIGDVQFRLGNTIIPHSSPKLHLADTVSLTFRDQKNRAKFATRTAWKTKDPLACPVASWADITRRVRSLPHCVDSTLVYHYTDEDKTTQSVTNDILIKNLRSTVAHLGFTALGYRPRDIGTHSIRSGAAMALVLSGHAAWRIMLTGRWKSSAFLVYVREQVQAFSHGVSDRMIENPNFFNVPDIDNPTAAASTTIASPLEANMFTGGASNNHNMLDVTFFG